MNLCKDCRWFKPSKMRPAATCYSPRRQPEPVYGRTYRSPWDARDDEHDCGPTGEWFDATTPQQAADRKEG